MVTKYVITFSNCTKNGVETPEKISNQTVIEFVTHNIAATAAELGYNLDNCTAYPVSGMYKGVSENSFRLEYISSVPLVVIEGHALWIKEVYNQESVLIETYRNGEYKAELLFNSDEIVEL